MNKAINVAISMAFACGVIWASAWLADVPKIYAAVAYVLFRVIMLDAQQLQDVVKWKTK
jgi:hypothetical protein